MPSSAIPVVCTTVNWLGMVAYIFNPRTQGHADLCELKLTSNLWPQLFRRKFDKTIQNSSQNDSSHFPSRAYSLPNHEHLTQLTVPHVNFFLWRSQISKWIISSKRLVPIARVHSWVKLMTILSHQPAQHLPALQGQSPHPLLAFDLSCNKHVVHRCLLPSSSGEQTAGVSICTICP